MNIQAVQNLNMTDIRKGIRMKAKEYLSQLKEMNIEIENKMLEKEMWEHIAKGTSANINGERVQRSGSGDKMERASIEAMEIEKQINGLSHAYADKKKEIERIIKKIPCEECSFLYKHYFANIRLKEIAAMKGNGYSWATTMHKKSLASVQKILDRRNDEKQSL